jgi:large subunit ribosomal protein L21
VRSARAPKPYFLRPRAPPHLPAARSRARAARPPTQAAPGQKIVFERVLATKGADANSLAVGHPYVKGAKVHAQVLEHFKDKKIIVFKMKAKKHYRKKMGHRQAMTRFLVTDVQYN